MKPEDWVLAFAISNYIVGYMPAVRKPDTVRLSPSNPDPAVLTADYTGILRWTVLQEYSGAEWG